jgi:hypothetical protein
LLVKHGNSAFKFGQSQLILSRLRLIVYAFFRMLKISTGEAPTANVSNTSGA